MFSLFVYRAATPGFCSHLRRFIAGTLIDDVLKSALIQNVHSSACLIFLLQLNTSAFR